MAGAPRPPMVVVGEGEARMNRRLAVAAARIARAVRGLWPDRNPLRRRLDRIEAVIVGGLAVAFLAGAPLAAVAAWHAADSGGARAARMQQAARHRVPAVLVTSAPALGRGYQATVQIRWRTPDGAWRTGVAPVASLTQAGGKAMVWADAAGRLTGPPLQPVQATEQALLAAVLAPAALGLAVVGAGALAHYLLGRRRLAAWDADWRAAGPQWTRQR